MWFRCFALSYSLVFTGASPVVQLDPWGADSIRIRVAPQGGVIVDPPFSPLLFPHPSTRSSSSSSSSLSNGNLVVTVDASTGFFHASRASDAATLFSTVDLSFGVAANGSHAPSVSASLSISVPGQNKLYGLGEHRTGQLDATGYSKNLSDSQYYSRSHGADIMIPYYVAHPLGVGLLWALPSYGSVSLGANGVHTWSSLSTENIDLWVTTTSASPLPPTEDPATSSPLAALLRNYVDAVGHAAPMPPYVAGFWACKNRYRSQAQVLDVVRRYRSLALPIDIITIDYMHWTNFGDWSFNPTCWPDPQAMVDELSDLGVELAVTFWPYVTPQGAWFNNFTAAGLFATDLDGNSYPVETWAGNMHLVDEFDPAARTAIYAAFKAGYGKYGIKTVWLDGSEPERSTSDNFGKLRFSAGTDSELGEAWIQQHVRAMAEGFQSDGYQPNEFFLLPRSTWAGASRYSAGVWSGDIESTFDELGKQVRVLQQMALSGHALWTNDGGGYGGGDPASPEFQELIVRWLQASAFFPIMRLHGQRKGGPPDDECGNTGGDNEPWNLAPDPQHYAAIAAVMQLRANLKDYTLNLNRETVATGLPMIRPMVLAFPADAACAGVDVEDQWMYGKDYLVGPVLTYKATSRSIYLPNLGKGWTWVYFWNGTDSGAGGGRVSVNTTLMTDFPLFLRTPIAPPAPMLNVSSLWSSARNDIVTCASAVCYSDQVPQGGYETLFNEGTLWSTSQSVEIEGKTYTLTALTNFYSSSATDNADSVTGPPNASYAAVALGNGFILTTAAPGTRPLFSFTKDYNASHTDTAAFSSASGIAWAAQNGYTNVGTLGWIL